MMHPSADANIHKQVLTISLPTFALDSSPDPELEERRMIGDFDGSANALWTLYGNEAKSHDGPNSNVEKKTWTVSLYSSGHVFPLPTGSVMLIHGDTGWFIFCRPHRIHT